MLNYDRTGPSIVHRRSSWKRQMLENTSAYANKALCKISRKLPLIVFSTSNSQSSTFPVGYKLLLNGTHSPSPENIDEIRKSSSNESCERKQK